MANSGPLTWPARWFCLQILLLHATLFRTAMPRTVVKTLPGYPGTLPFHLETGYVGVGDNEDIQLFYYFIESERDPIRDPLLLWLTGGPGCSAFSGLVYEMGPLTFDYETFDGTLPTFKLNPYSWTKFASVIFLDEPVGTGFSYSTSSEGWYTSDTKSSQAIYDFLRKWMIDRPAFRARQLYLAGDSYSGTMIPMVVLEMTKALENGDKLFKNLKGYLIGNPMTSVMVETNSRVEYAHRMALISDTLYKALKLACNGSYIDVDEDNVDCLEKLELYEACMAEINGAMILEPSCTSSALKRNLLKRDTSPIDDISVDTFIQMPQQKELWCRKYNYVLSKIWANDPDVQEALRVRVGTVLDWKRCNNSLAYTYDVVSVVEYHRNLSSRPYRALIYSGDHDTGAPYFATQRWIDSLNMTTTDDWRPWFVGGQVAGYTQRYLSKEEYSLTYATVLGAGHTAPEYKPKQCRDMVARWFGYQYL